MSEIWYCNGLRFSCQQCGQCCWDEGEYTQVYVDRDDLRKMAAYLDLYPDAFYKRFVKPSEGFDVLRSCRGACIMLRDGRCRVYSVRPRQCRTWPFWASNLASPSAWNEAAQNCPGINRGRLFTRAEIDALKKQKCWWADERHPSHCHTRG